MTAPNIKRRKCPTCLKGVQWASKKTSSSSPIVCIHPECGWVGPYCDSMPVSHKKVDAKAHTHIQASLQRILDFMVSGHKAIQKVEEYALAHDFADPDPVGNDKMKDYLGKIGQLMFLRDVITITNLDEDHKAQILTNEVHALFPDGKHK